MIGIDALLIDTIKVFRKVTHLNQSQTQFSQRHWWIWTDTKFSGEKNVKTKAVTDILDMWTKKCNLCTKICSLLCTLKRSNLGKSCDNAPPMRSPYFPYSIMQYKRFLSEQIGTLEHLAWVMRQDALQIFLHFLCEIPAYFNKIIRSYHCSTRKGWAF